MENLHEGDLILSVSASGKQVILKWQGESRSKDPAGFLDPYLSNLVHSLDDNDLVVDFRELESMNSSTVLPIINLIKKLEEKTINTEILYNENSSWQKASFIPLSAITKIYKHIKVVPRKGD
ncbi:MAG: hypothetical protein JXR70_10800 [Spirochaetales bacterium]|nr:hypothetical protein [Spirochaetales bacterium]